MPIMLWRLVYEFGRNCLRDRQSASDVLASLLYFHNGSSYIKTIWRTFVCGRRSKCALFVNICYIGQTCLYKQRGRPNCWARSNARARLINSFVYKSMRRTWRHRKLAELLEGVRMEYILCCNGRLVLTIHLYQPHLGLRRRPRFTNPLYRAKSN